MGRLRKRAGLGLVLGAGLLAVTCAKEADPIRRVLTQVTEAVEARKAEAVLEHLAPDFEGQGGLRRADAGAELRRYFFAYEKIDVTLFEVTSEREGETARVQLRAELSGKPKDIGGLQGLLPALSAFRFDLELKSTGGAWLVTRASWERLDRSPGT